jgi:hypothetical protein
MDDISNNKLKRAMIRMINEIEKDSKRIKMNS